MGIVSQKLRDSAKGQPCCFNTPWCTFDNDTTVLCHIRDEAKGMGNKANDFSAAFGCVACHEAIDQHFMPLTDELIFVVRAMQKTLRIWRDMGLITIAGDNEKPKPPSQKTVQRSTLYRVRG